VGPDLRVFEFDCLDNLYVGVEFDTSASRTEQQDVLRAVWRFPSLVGPIRDGQLVEPDMGASGAMVGCAELDNGREIGCRILVYSDWRRVDVGLPEEGFSRLYPPWHYGPPPNEEQQEGLQAGMRWLEALAAHVRAAIPVLTEQYGEF
jgi:hypothetical protein